MVADSRLTIPKPGPLEGSQFRTNSSVCRFPSSSVLLSLTTTCSSNTNTVNIMMIIMMMTTLIISIVIIIIMLLVILASTIIFICIDITIKSNIVFLRLQTSAAHTPPKTNLDKPGSCNLCRILGF